MSSNKDYVRPRHTLSLADRVAVIEAFEKKSEGMRDLARKYNCSLTQIKNIIRRKNEYLHEWNNNGDLMEVRKKQAVCFLSVGAVVCEYVHRWKCYNDNEDIPDALLYKTGQEVSDSLNTPEIRATNYWMQRIKNKFKISCPSMYSTRMSLDIQDIIKDLLRSYSPNSSSPQILNSATIRRYFKDPDRDQYSDHSSLSGADDTFYSNESSSDISAVNGTAGDESTLPIMVQQEVISEGVLEIMDVEEADGEHLNGTEVSPGSSKQGIVDSYKGALSYLGPLEEFVLLQEDVRAIGLINQLENLFKDKINETVHC